MNSVREYTGEMRRGPEEGICNAHDGAEAGKTHDSAGEEFENRLSAISNGNSQSVVSKKSSKRRNRWQHSFKCFDSASYRCIDSTECVGEKGREEDTTSSRRPNLKETSQLKVDEIIKCRRHN